MLQSRTYAAFRLHGINSKNTFKSLFACRRNYHLFLSINQKRHEHEQQKPMQQQYRNMMALSDPINQRAKSMMEKYEETLKSINELNNKLVNDNDNDNTKQKLKQKEITILSKELSKLTPLVKQYSKMISLVEEIKTIDELVTEEVLTKDEKEEWNNEISKLNTAIKTIETKISNLVLPTDDDDYYSNAILEIRAGTGGDEAAIFASDLLSSYEKTVKDRGSHWTFEILTISKNDIGGVREAVVSINSNNNNSYMNDNDDENDDINDIMKFGPYGLFKFESGVHRVQRVPINDVRIHTSTASIAVLPAISSSSSSNDVAIPSSELKIETMRSSGAGGQHVNTTESAVRITHIPTGITASIQDERSQHKNKAKAINLITARVRNKEKEELLKKQGDTKKLLMGGGERSERIRTYNFQQDRITDHRIKHTVHGIENLLNGGMSDSNAGLIYNFCPLLLSMHRDELLNDLS